jgi:Tfp pilus assembly protein PilF
LFNLELEPDNAIVNGNYAFFLTNIRENHDQTEAYYKKALKHLSYQDLSLL